MYLHTREYSSPWQKDKTIKKQILNRETVLLHFEYDGHGIQRKLFGGSGRAPVRYLEEGSREEDLSVNVFFSVHTQYPRNLKDLP